MRVLDTGVVVAAFASWHEAHGAARAEMAQRPGIAAHSLVETYSVLTRLPAPHRVPADLAARFLEVAFPGPALVLEAEQLKHLVVMRLPILGISGGAVYDAVIAETVRIAGGTLVTLDRRALATYDRIGCPAELLS